MWRRQDGSAAFPTIIAVALLMVGLAVIVYMARVPNVIGELQYAAASAARAGTQFTSVQQGHDAASTTVQQQLAERNVPCVDFSEQISSTGTSGGQLLPGATVTVRVWCTIHVGDLTWVPLPTSTVVGAEFTATVDEYRGRP